MGLEFLSILRFRIHRAQQYRLLQNEKFASALQGSVLTNNENHEILRRDLAQAFCIKQVCRPQGFDHTLCVVAVFLLAEDEQRFWCKLRKSHRCVEWKGSREYLAKGAGYFGLFIGELSSLSNQKSPLPLTLPAKRARIR